jgi:HSP20 family protein
MSTQLSPDPVKPEVAPKTRLEELFAEFEKLEKAIADRAFELFHARGRMDGFDLADWLRAETEFLQPFAVDIEKTDDEVIVKAEVPGFEPKNLDVVIEPRRMAIRARREEATDTGEGEAERRERSSSELFRRLWLPVKVDPTAATAKLDKGILTVTIRRVAKVEPSKVEVTVA